jgi:Ala-tRNA(Pro) deacylase
MLTTRDEILARLAGMGITATTHDHPPVFTVEQAREHTHHLPGGHCKNLFLKDKKGRLWLVTLLDDRQVDLNALSKRLGAARFSFGRPELLREVLGVEPGSVTPLAIVNDGAGRVTHVLDVGLLAAGTVNCHPLSNDATTAIGSTDLLRFVRETGHEPVILDLDGEALTGA